MLKKIRFYEVFICKTFNKNARRPVDQIYLN